MHSVQSREELRVRLLSFQQNEGLCVEERFHGQKPLMKTAVIIPPNDNTIELTRASTPIIAWPDRITRPPTTFKKFAAAANFILSIFRYTNGNGDAN